MSLKEENPGSPLLSGARAKRQTAWDSAPHAWVWGPALLRLAHSQASALPAEWGQPPIPSPLVTGSPPPFQRLTGTRVWRGHLSIGAFPLVCDSRHLSPTQDRSEPASG